MDPLSYVAGRRMGGAVAGIDRSFDSSELVAAFPVLHERVEIGFALMTMSRSALLADLRVLPVNWEIQKLVDA